MTNSSGVGLARKKTQTISFVERGFERLGIGHQAVGFSWCSCMVKLQDRYRVNISKTDTCPISPYPKSLGVVVKVREYGSVRCRVLNGSKGNFPWIF